MRTYAFLITFSVLACSFLVQSQQPLVGTIQGTVKDQHGAPVPNASLTTTNLDSVEPASHRRYSGTDQQGFYQFVDVSPGRYSILVSKSGYRDFKVDLVTVHPGEAVKMPEIKMSPVASH